MRLSLEMDKLRVPTPCDWRKATLSMRATMVCADSPGSESRACTRSGFPGNPGGLVVSVRLIGRKRVAA